MKTVIFKKPLIIKGGIQNIEIPKGSDILCIQMQNGAPTIWFKCDPEKELEVRRIRMTGTGWEEKDLPGAYIGTVIEESGFVWHYFDEGAVK